MKCGRDDRRYYFYSLVSGFVGQLGLRDAAAIRDHSVQVRQRSVLRLFACGEVVRLAQERRDRAELRASPDLCHMRDALVAVRPRRSWCRAPWNNVAPARLVLPI